MPVGDSQRWLEWAREIQAISQTGLYFCCNEFDQIRYRRLLDISSEIFAEYTGVSSERMQSLFLDETGYATPKVDVRAAIFRDGKILLVKEKMDGLWSMPGGWADVNEAPSAMVAREVREESGLDVRVDKLIGVFEANRDRDPVQVYHAYKVVFLCEILGGEMRTSNETTAVDLFPEDQLPPFSAQRTPPRVVEEAFAHLRDPQRPARFD